MRDGVEAYVECYIRYERETTNLRMFLHSLISKNVSGLVSSLL